MEVKGTAVIPIMPFVKEKFGSRTDEWYNSLSKESAEIIKNATSLGWYDLKTAIIEPTQKICDVFYGGDDKGALEMGRFSADHGLKGVYKIFVRLGSPTFIISKASDIMPTYYKGSSMKVTENEKNKAVAQLSDFPEISRLVELRIAGWMERALELNGCKGVKVAITQSITKGSPLTEFVATWA